MKKIFSFLLVGLGFALLTSSCEEEAVLATDSEITEVSNIATEDVLAMQLNAVVSDTIIETIKDLGAGAGNIDFGSSGTLTFGNDLLIGEISYVKTHADTAIVMFDGFTINGNEFVLGKVMIKNADASWTITSTDSIYAANGKKIYTEGQLTRSVTANSAPSILDDVYTYTGSATAKVFGLANDSVTYTSTIDAANPLVRNFNYRCITKGKLSITSDAKTFDVDFGDGTKDSKAQVIYKGRTADLIIRK